MIANKYHIELDGCIVMQSVGGLLCRCPTALALPSYAQCDHVERVLTNALDAPWMSEMILGTGELVRASVPTWLKIPLFVKLDGSYFMYPVKVSPNEGPAGMYGTCTFQVPATTPMDHLPGTMLAVGKAFASGGIILPGEGRRSIANNVSAWVGTQMVRMANEHIDYECDGMTHLGEDVYTTHDQISMLLTGECLTCHDNQYDPGADVPSF